jgi:hypothetical protein
MELTRLRFFREIIQEPSVEHFWYSVLEHDRHVTHNRIHTVASYRETHAPGTMIQESKNHFTRSRQGID